MLQVFQYKRNDEKILFMLSGGIFYPPEFLSFDILNKGREESWLSWAEDSWLFLNCSLMERNSFFLEL